MNLNDFKSELEGYLGKLSGLMPVGHPWWGFDPKSKPAGVQLFAGQELSREAYPKHWELVNGGKRTVVTEEEWQEMVANQGFCQFYSSGDGSTTYRMPLVKDVHPKFVAALAEAGQYLEAGVPNITGTVSPISSPGTSDSTNAEWVFGASGGSFFAETKTTVRAVSVSSQTSSSHPAILHFDASRSSSVYRDDIDTVQPEALTLLVGEYVISSVASLSTSESENLLASVTQLEASKLDKTGGGITGNLSVSGDVFVGGTINASISGTSENAVKASQDALGNIIDETYATKASVADVVRSVNGVTPDTAGDARVSTDPDGYSFVSCSDQGSGYTRFNELQIVFITRSISHSNGWVSFPKAFKDSSYVVACMHADTTNQGTTYFVPKVSKKETTGMNIIYESSDSSVDVDLVVIGFWS